MRTEAEIRKLNLIEVLQEEAQEEGREVQEPPEEAITEWTEEEIRRYFATGSSAEQGSKPEEKEPSGLQVPHEEYAKWLPRSTGPNSTSPFVLCFHNAGSAEDMYTSEGTGSRKQTSPLLDWCRSNQWECLAPQLPGRNERRQEPFLCSAREIAERLLPVLQGRIGRANYAVVAHSMGTWVAFEFLGVVRERGLRMPLVAFFSAMPSPEIPMGLRPWKQQKHLNTEEFQGECRGWDINEVVFSAHMWKVYEPLLRSDFKVFDEYCSSRPGEAPFSFPLVSFWGRHDKRVTREMVEGWQRFTTGPFSCIEIEGNHLWPMEKGPKAVWLKAITDRLREAVG